MNWENADIALLPQRKPSNELFNKKHTLLYLNQPKMLKLLVLFLAIYGSCATDINEKRRTRNKHLELWDTITYILNTSGATKDNQLPPELTDIFRGALNKPLDKKLEHEISLKFARFVAGEMKKIYEKEKEYQEMRLKNKCNLKTAS